MPAEPANSAAGAHTIRRSSQPISQHSAATMTTKAASVPSTLLRSRDGARARHEPRSDEHRQHRPEPEHHQRMTKQPVGKATPPRTGPILSHRQGRDIPYAAAVKIA